MRQAPVAKWNTCFNKKSVAFFEGQFQRQVRDQEYALNLFEILTIDYVRGSVFDLGCGVGNLRPGAAISFLFTIRVNFQLFDAKGSQKRLP